MGLQYKSFITHKRGETDEDIQDSIAMNPGIGRFAISDGVTNSFLPQILSNILTRLFVDGEGENCFPPSTLPDIFLKARNKYMDSLDEDTRILLEMAEEEFHFSAATFVGITIKSSHISWQVLGDSCLFILSQNRKLQCICSMNVFANTDGNLQVEFDNFPGQIHSNGEIVGEWITGEQKLSQGWVVLASDAMSQWIIQQHNEGKNPIDRLWNIKDKKKFETFVNREYHENRLKSDDESVILIKTSSNKLIKRRKNRNAKPRKSIKAYKFKGQRRNKKTHKYGNLKLRNQKNR